MKRVVVTGLGCVTPIGNTVAAFRDSLHAGRSGIAPFDPSFPGLLGPDPGLRFRTTAMVKNFVPADHFTTGIVGSTDLGAQFAIVAARQAAAQSNILQHHDPGEIAIVTGCACGGRSADEDANRHLYTRNARVPPTTIIKTMASAGASSIAIDLKIGGSTLNISTACASGTHAIGLAFHMVRSGMAPAALAGGYEAALTFGFLRAWDSMRVVSPTTCRPFAADRDGMTLGEGAAMLTLEPLESALARNAPIYAEIIGFGMSADAHHITQPRAEGAAIAIRRALKDAASTTRGVEHPPSTAEVLHPSRGDGRDANTTPEIHSLINRIGYINAHATGTPTNDAVEAAAIHQALGPEAACIPVSGIKSLTGHGIGATGAIEAVATILGLHDRLLPHSAGVPHANVDPTLHLDIITGQPRPLTPGKDIALSNSLAFGGLNAVLALRHYP